MTDNKPKPKPKVIQFSKDKYGAMTVLYDDGEIYQERDRNYWYKIEVPRPEY